MSCVLQVPHKPPVKEQTRAEEFRLETGFRAVERTEFDKYVRICCYIFLSRFAPASTHCATLCIILHQYLLKLCIGC